MPSSVCKDRPRPGRAPGRGRAGATEDTQLSGRRWGSCLRVCGEARTCASLGACVPRRLGACVQVCPTTASQHRVCAPCPRMAAHSRHTPGPHCVRAVNSQKSWLSQNGHWNVWACGCVSSYARPSVYLWVPGPAPPRVGDMFPRVDLNFIFCLLRPSVHTPGSEPRILLCARAPQGGSSTARVPAQLCVSLKGPECGPPRASPPHPLATPEL